MHYPSLMAVVQRLAYFIHNSLSFTFFKPPTFKGEVILEWPSFQVLHEQHYPCVWQLKDIEELYDPRVLQLLKNLCFLESLLYFISFEESRLDDLDCHTLLCKLMLSQIDLTEASFTQSSDVFMQSEIPLVIKARAYNIVVTTRKALQLFAATYTTAFLEFSWFRKVISSSFIW